MALALCVLFDPRTERLIRELWIRLEAKGIRTLATHTHGRHHPHLSYAVLLSWDLERVRLAVDRLPDGGPFELTVQGTLSFPRGRAALAPSVSPDVAARQEQAVQILAGTGAVVHRHYVPARWVPHVAVATRTGGASVAQVITAVSDVLPLTIHADRAALIDSSTAELWPLAHIP